MTGQAAAAAAHRGNYSNIDTGRGGYRHSLIYYLK